MIKCVIFDLDGVIVSTTEAHFRAWVNLFKKHFNIVLDPKLERLTKGVSRIDSLRVLLHENGIEINYSEENELLDEKNKDYIQLISLYDQNYLLPNILYVLDLLKSRGIRIALGSASKNGPKLLNSLGISNYFDYIVDPANLEGKPKPDIFIDAMNHFNLSPNECLGIEDSIAGIQAIKSAGMKALGIGEEDLLLADKQILDFNHIKDDELYEFLS